MQKVLASAIKYLSPLVSTRAAGMYMLIFAAAIGIATFVENDFGTSAAQKMIFKTTWFELLLALFGVTIIVNIFKFRMIQLQKWPLFIFHIAIVVILIGAGVTRYFGYEGVMHIRENEASNTFLSAETALNFEILKGDQRAQFSEDVLFASLGNNNWQGSYQIGNDIITVKVKQFIPNPIQTLVEDETGLPILKIVVAGMGGREEYFIKQGEVQTFKNVTYNFNGSEIDGAFNIVLKGDSLLFKSNRPFTQMVMATQKLDTLIPSGNYYPLRLRSMYSDGVNSFVFGDFNKKATVKLDAGSPKIKNESVAALVMEVDVNGKKIEQIVYGQIGVQGKSEIFDFGATKIGINYGSKLISLPFGIKLYDFIMEKYPGTNSAASYESKVQLIDPRTSYKQDERIYMNHILQYEGFRFFQSSFDQDELGTYLSVNHDYWGTHISYLGYFLLTIGLILSLFSKKSRFSQVTEKIRNMQSSSQSLMVLLVVLLNFSIAYGQEIMQPSLPKIDASHAKKFSELVVQDYKGRMKPVHTLTRELLRKLSRKESFNSLNADQVVLSMFSNPKSWYGQDMIKIGKEKEIQNLLNTDKAVVSYDAFFEPNGAYKLRDQVRRAYSLQPIDRNAFDKELMKIDERVNVANMIYSGSILKLLPVKGDVLHTWAAAQSDDNTSREAQAIADQFFGTYASALLEAEATGNYNNANIILDDLRLYQESVGSEIIPSRARIEGEILLNQLNVFSRLSIFYTLLALAFLTILFVSVFKPDFSTKNIYKILFGLLLVGFFFHTVGLGLRWYVSGRAPWSNGYESMIYIAWTTTLAGLIFARRSFGGLAATMVLAGTLLMVAGLSFLDPEITPLVPVLKSYWLTIHVSLEAGSYGFLMLGALIGLINLILMIFLSEKNQHTIARIVKEMTYISEITLIGGLTMVSIGTYLGGVWANESWGRYWGWDAKETWALVTILVYAFILHMRLIPKMGGTFIYNMASLFGWATVIMTYYGVNYYLSGLHSYAAGDPVPIPKWVYIAVASLIAISIMAYWRKRKFKLIN